MRITIRSYTFYLNVQNSYLYYITYIPPRVPLEGTHPKVGRE
jgi:hypothetical protein